MVMLTTSTFEEGPTSDLLSRMLDMGERHDNRATIDGREERGDRTAEALLTAGRRVFAELGYHGASVRAIAGAAEVNPALVRYHFGSKEGLYQQVIERAMSGLRERLLQALITDDGGGLRSRVHALVRAYLNHLAEYRDVPRLIQRALLDGDPNLRRIAGEHLRPLLDAARPLVAPRAHHSIDEMITSIFGALIAPFLYEPLLTDLFDRDVLSPESIAQRQQHIEVLIDYALDRLQGASEPQEPQEPQEPGAR